MRIGESHLEWNLRICRLCNWRTLFDFRQFGLFTWARFFSIASRTGRVFDQFEAQTLSQNSATEPFPTTIDYNTSRIIRLVTRHWLLPDTKQVHWANLIASPNFQF